MPARELALLRLEDDEGLVGYGEAAPLESYDGVSLDAVIDALRDGPPPRALAPGPRGLGAGASSTSRRRREDRPLGEPGADAIVVNRTLPGGPPGEMAGRPREAVREGYSCLKLKVGLPDDLERVAAVREAIGPWPALRMDANGAWSLDGARAAIASWRPSTCSWWSSPAARWRSWRCSAEVEVPPGRRRVDRGARRRARWPPSCGACDAVNVKLARRAGSCAAREAVRAARYSGLERLAVEHARRPVGHRRRPAARRLRAAVAGLRARNPGAVRRAARPGAAPARDGLMAVPQGPAWAWSRGRTR